MSFFGFGAFSSPVGQLVERATDNAASAGDLHLHLNICDAINESDNGPKEAVAAIRKRLTGNTKNFHIINLTLTVLETCVKNCSIRFHSKIAQKDFLNDLMKVISPKNNPPTIVRERILGLIQYWADAFQGKPQLAAVGDLYEQLKDEGVEFPPIDLDNLAPVETQGRGGGLQLTQPPSSSEGTDSGGSSRVPRPHQQSSHVPRPPRPTGPLRPEQIAKLLSELDVVRKNIDIMNEIMSENEPGKESQEDSQLLDDLNRIVHSMQTRVAGLISHCSDEIVLESTLVINDDLNSLFVRYDRWLKNSAAAKASAQGPPPAETSTVVTEDGMATTTLTEPALPSSVGISYPSLDDPPPPSYEASNSSSANTGQLIDLGEELAPPTSAHTSDDIVSQLAQLGITSQPASTTVGGQPLVEISATGGGDDFDMFARSRTAYAQGGSSYADNKVDQNVSLSAAVHGRQETMPTQQPGDHQYANLSDWLAQTDLKPPESGSTTAESATSAEFDQFLEQRASKGDSLPPATVARTRPQMQKEEERSDELFQL